MNEWTVAVLTPSSPLYGAASATEIAPSGQYFASPHVRPAIHPVYQAQGVVAPTPQPTPPPSSAGAVLATIAIVFLSLGLLGVIAYLATGFGVVSVIICGVVALVPLTIVLLAVRWIDRWEPEPRGALWFAFLWGASASVVISLLVDFGVQIVVHVVSSGNNTAGELWGAVIQAPIVEESAKGLGILIIFLAVRRHFDGPVDGLVYAATVAAGFAFTENILYFGSSLLEDASSFGFVFLLRGLMSPFAHVMFTACTGIAIGIASRRKGTAPVFLAFLLGLIPAIALHALWNGATFLVTGLDQFLLYYAIVQIPLFLGAIWIVVWLRSREAAINRLRLGEYSGAGWFTNDEVSMLASSVGRRNATRWARSQGSESAGSMKRFIQTATALANTRQRIIAVGADPQLQAKEYELLIRSSRLRSELLSPAYA